MKEISKALSDAIFTVCNKIITNAKFDKTYKCRVVDKVSNNKYIVVKDNIEHIVSSAFSYNVNDIVTVLLPQNSWKDATIVYPQVDKNIPSMQTSISSLLSRMNVAETSIKLPDVRSDNNTPEWYFTNYSKNLIAEFKYSEIIGLPSVSGHTYTPLITIVPWSDKSGGYPRQIAWSGMVMYHRVGISLTEWGNWIELTNKEATT